MRGLAFEGGGARGAYQIGVVKALIESGYVFGGFVGTSIGAINAAVMAGSGISAALKLWENVSVETLFNEDEQPLIRFADIKGLNADLDWKSNARRKAALKIIGNRGFSTDKMKTFLERYIDEKTIRESGRDFGLVTISLSDRKPYELMRDDIPKGQLFNYVMASASHPFFRRESIEDNIYLDGAFYNNCPVNLLIKKDYDEIIAIRTNAHGIFRKIEDPRVKYIIPRDDLGSIMRFTPENSAVLIKLGYQDGLRFAKAEKG